MTTRDDDQPGDEPTPPSPTERRPGQRRARVVAGVAGLAAVLGGAAYVTTSALTADNSTTSSDVAARQLPLSTPPTSESAKSATADGITPSSSAGPTSGRSETPSAVPTVDAQGSPIPSQVVAQINEARRKMAEDGVKVQRPLTPKATSAAGEVQRTTKGSLKEGGILRMVSANKDLTGQDELAAVAGGVKKYRNVPCSQTFRFSSDPEPEKKPNLLMCWRTSQKKSVVAIVVDPKGSPSQKMAVDAIQEKWQSMS
ncbi:hypothetical protein ACWKSP_25610 [Micromonosporaceae bacterium Da 78-11]